MTLQSRVKLTSQYSMTLQSCVKLTSTMQCETVHQ